MLTPPPIPTWRIGQWNHSGSPRFKRQRNAGPAAGPEEATQMHGIIYLVGLIVVIMAILSFLGLR